MELATKADCEAFATIAEHTEQWGPLHIFVEHAIGEEEFWTALRRALDHLKSAEIVYLNSSHLHLRAAKKEDLKAIWSVVDAWDVMATDFGSPKLRFNKVLLGEQQGWEGIQGVDSRGLADIPGLSEEEFLREVRKVEVGFEATQDENQGPVPE